MLRMGLGLEFMQFGQAPPARAMTPSWGEGVLEMGYVI